MFEDWQLEVDSEEARNIRRNEQGDVNRGGALHV
jgi:hypothetical protein